MAEVKPFWKSKTIWVNAIALVALIVQQATGFVVNPELQGFALIGVNALLRMVTKSAVTVS